MHLAVQLVYAVSQVLLIPHLLFFGCHRCCQTLRDLPWKRASAEQGMLAWRQRQGW